MLLIYSEKKSPRLLYVLQLYFKELIPTEYEFTVDKNHFQSAAIPKLNYSKSEIADALFLLADDLLFETTVTEKNISIGKHNEITTLFVTTKGDLPFDPFAAAFYLATRYEEYLPFTPDTYDRFPDQQSLNFRKGFHEVPVVNHYALWLKELLLHRYPELLFQGKKFRFQLTYDIDFAFAYLGKGVIRNLGGYVKSLLKADIEKIKERTSVLFNHAHDPYDTYDYQMQLLKQYKLNALYFFLLSDYGKLDKNIPHDSSYLKKLIAPISANAGIGIHSGFASNRDPSRIRVEKERLETMSGQKIFRNRQHFLVLHFPNTYRQLLMHGIIEDYSLGYASMAGFRAGISDPFFWYDLLKDETTGLRVFPIAAMDASLYYYQKLSATEAAHKINALISVSKQVQGYFQMLAHNDLLSEKGVWKNWRTEFEKILASV